MNRSRRAKGSMMDNIASFCIKQTKGFIILENHLMNLSIDNSESMFLVYQLAL